MVRCRRSRYPEGVGQPDLAGALACEHTSTPLAEHPGRRYGFSIERGGRMLVMTTGIYTLDNQKRDVLYVLSIVFILMPTWAVNRFPSRKLVSPSEAIA